MEKLIETIKRALQERPVLDSKGKRMASTVTTGLPLIELVSCLAKSFVGSTLRHFNKPHVRSNGVDSKKFI
jgi:hypothetical protein